MPAPTAITSLSLDEIACSWRAKRGYSIHYHITALLYAVEAVQQMGFVSRLCVRHELVGDGGPENVFSWPDGASSIVRIAVRCGDRWRVVPLDTAAYPYMGSSADGDFFDADYSASDVLTGSGGDAQTDNCWWDCGCWWDDKPCKGGAVIDEAGRRILVGKSYTADSILVSYFGVGPIDTMSEVPLYAQAAVEAYIDWKYAANKGDVSRGEAQDWERKWDNQHRLLRARLDPLTLEDVECIFAAKWCEYKGTMQPNYANIVYRVDPNSYTYTYSTMMNSLEIQTVLGADSASHPSLIGKTIQVIIGSGFTKPKGDGFTQPDDSGVFQFTDGSTFSGGTIIVFYQ